MCKTLVVFSFFFMTLSVTFAQRQFWGTASQGGVYNNGFIFKTDSIGDNLEIIHNFQSTVDGENIGALLYASNNKLYGLASSGGQNAAGVFAGGTFFEYDLDTDRLRVIEHFGPSNTDLPNVFLPKGEGLAGLTEVSPGVIYGLMNQGKSVFSYNMATGAMSKPFTLPTYQGGATNSTLQNRIAEAFYKAADGYLYAATYTNSSCPIPNPNMGSILRLDPANNALTVRYKSSCLVDAGFSYNGYFAEVNGKLYSTTLYGGTNNQGVIYEYAPATNTYTKRHDFAGSTYGYEASSLVVAKNGKLYGTAFGGGVSEANLPAGGGILYEFDLTTNTFTKKHDFLLGVSWLGDMGSFPRSLISSKNGKLYGTTQFGVFEYNPATSEIRMGGRFWSLGFAASMLQVCRKPAYQYQSVTAYNICSDAAFSLDLASTNATTVTWKHDNVVDVSKTTPELSFTAFQAADAGTWVCTLTNECGTTVAPAITLSLGEPDQPTITADGPLTFCAGETVTLAAPEGFSSYAWSTGDTSREIIVSESGAYTVVVNNGCESPVSEAIAVTVLNAPGQPAITADGQLAFCAGETVTLAAPQGFSGYVWSTGETSREILVSESGSYTVMVNNGCESPVSEATTVTVHSVPGQPAIAADGPLTFCAGETVVLAAPEGFSGYAWSTGDTSQEIMVSESGEYTVVINNGCESPVSKATTVTVHVLPPTPTGIEAPSVDVLKAIGTSERYEWTLNDGVLDAQTSEIHVTESGLYKVRSISTGGCRSTDFASLSFIVTGLETSAENAIVIYPNPTKGTVNVKVSNSMRGQTEISLYNATGSLVLSQSIRFSEEASPIPLENLPPGLYNMMLRKDEKVVLRKLMIR
ncbi:MAG TPA: choice-of-anchor tandem repeat GloVer-containing protein [Chryseolinea sp.]